MYTYLIKIPIYMSWVGSFVLEYLVSLIASTYYAYMAGVMDFDYLYSIARNLEQKKFTNIAFWYSVVVLGLNLINLIIPTFYIIIYILNYLFNGMYDDDLILLWIILGWAPTFALLFSVPFFISSMSWTSMIRVL